MPAPAVRRAGAADAEELARLLVAVRDWYDESAGFSSSKRPGERVLLMQRRP